MQYACKIFRFPLQSKISEEFQTVELFNNKKDFSACHTKTTGCPIRQVLQ